MRRLIKADNENMRVILNRVENSIDDLNEVYYILLDNLNELFKSYPDVYNEINMSVKLPTKDDIENIANMKNSFSDIKEHFEDDNYLGIIKGE